MPRVSARRRSAPRLAGAYVDRRFRAVAPEKQIDDPVPRLHSAQMQLVEKIGQHRLLEPDLVPALLEGEAEAACISAKTVALAQACGEQATG